MHHGEVDQTHSRLVPDSRPSHRTHARRCDRSVMTVISTITSRRTRVRPRVCTPCALGPPHAVAKSVPHASRAKGYLVAACQHERSCAGGGSRVRRQRNSRPASHTAGCGQRSATHFPIRGSRRCQQVRSWCCAIAHRRILPILTDVSVGFFFGVAVFVYCWASPLRTAPSAPQQLSDVAALRRSSSQT